MQSDCDRYTMRWRTVSHYLCHALLTIGCGAFVSLWLTLSRTRHDRTAVCSIVFSIIFSTLFAPLSTTTKITALCDELHHLRIRVAKISRFSWVFCAGFVWVSVCVTKTVCRQTAWCRLVFTLQQRRRVQCLRCLQSRLCLFNDRKKSDSFVVRWSSMEDGLAKRLAYGGWWSFDQWSETYICQLTSVGCRHSGGGAARVHFVGEIRFCKLRVTSISRVPGALRARARAADFTWVNLSILPELRIDKIK